MRLLGFTETQFAWIHGANVFGLIIASQVNRVWLRRRSSAEVLLMANVAQVCVALMLVTGAHFGFLGTNGNPWPHFLPLVLFRVCQPKCHRTGVATIHEKCRERVRADWKHSDGRGGLVVGTRKLPAQRNSHADALCDGRLHGPLPGAAP